MSSSTQAVATPKRGRRRGTSNKNARGSVEDRRRRRHWLMDRWASDKSGYVRCYRCGTHLTFDSMTIDRIVPGSKGGRYTRNNIRPACQFCNSSTSHQARLK